MKHPSYQDHLEELQEKLEQEPDNVPVLLDLGFLFFNEAHIPEKALAYYHRALELDPRNTAIMHWIALVHYFERVDFDKALEVLKQALLINPNSPECLSCYAAVLSDDPSVSASDYFHYIERAVQAAPEWPSLHLELAMAYAYLARWNDAEAEITKAYDVYEPSLSDPKDARRSYFQRIVTGQGPDNCRIIDAFADRIRRREVHGRSR